MPTERITETGITSAATPADGVIRCALITAGRSRNRRNWTEPVLQAAVSRFEGATALLDHATRPSVRDTLGAWASVAWNASARAIEGDLHFLEAQRPTYLLCKEILARRAAGKPAPDIGISIDVGIRAHAEQDGSTTPDEITEVYSADLVTRPAAAGKLTRVVQQACPEAGVRADATLEEETMPPETTDVRGQPLCLPTAPPAAIPPAPPSTLAALQEERDRLVRQVRVTEPNAGTSSSRPSRRQRTCPCQPGIESSSSSRTGSSSCRSFRTPSSASATTWPPWPNFRS